MNTFKTVDEYIASYPKKVQEVLIAIRNIVKEKAPEALEEISYGMPAYKTQQKPLVYFGAFAKHIGFYATPSGHSTFEGELKNYKQGKGSVQFPLNQDIPYEIISRIVEYRVKENQLKK